jgi:hypothetical protein
MSVKVNKNYESQEKKVLHLHYTTASKISSRSKKGSGRKFDKARSADQERLYEEMKRLYGGGGNDDDSIWYQKLYNLYNNRVNQYYNTMLTCICEKLYGVS